VNHEELEFEGTLSPSSADIDFLTQKINLESVNQGSAYPFAIFVRGKERRIVAGCNGSIVYGSIYTDQLYVNPSHRDSGLGKKLMEAVHELGKKHGCTLASVTTMSFQAPAFYQKLGYKIDFSRKGYYNDAVKIFMSKTI